MRTGCGAVFLVGLAAQAPSTREARAEAGMVLAARILIAAPVEHLHHRDVLAHAVSPRAARA